MGTFEPLASEADTMQETAAHVLKLSGCDTNIPFCVSFHPNELECINEFYPAHAATDNFGHTIAFAEGEWDGHVPGLITCAGAGAAVHLALAGGIFLHINILHGAGWTMTWLWEGDFVLRSTSGFSPDGAHTPWHGIGTGPYGVLTWFPNSLLSVPPHFNCNSGITSFSLIECS